MAEEWFLIGQSGEEWFLIGQSGEEGYWVLQRNSCRAVSVTVGLLESYCRAMGITAQHYLTVSWFVFVCRSTTTTM